MSADELRAIIERTGISARRFARDVMGRDERTVRRWLAGEAIPGAAARWLKCATVRQRGGRVLIAVECRA